MEEDQMGFRPNRYTIDNIFINRLIFKKLMNLIYIYICITYFLTMYRRLSLYIGIK